MTDRHTFMRRFTTALFVLAVLGSAIWGRWSDVVALTAAMVAFRRLT